MNETNNSLNLLFKWDKIFQNGSLLERSTLLGTEIILSGNWEESFTGICTKFQNENSSLI